MARKELLIPFLDGKPCWWDGSQCDERKTNYTFNETFEIVGFSRGCSSAKMCLKKVIDKPDEWGRYFTWEVFLTDILDIIKANQGLIISGEWTFVKRGANWGIKLVNNDTRPAT